MPIAADLKEILACPKCTGALEMFSQLKSSNLLVNFLKKMAAISLSLVQLELQKLIFELGLFGLYQGVEKMEARSIEGVFQQMPDPWMSDAQKKFARAVLAISCDRLVKLRETLP